MLHDLINSFLYCTLEDSKFCIVDNTKSITRISAYEISEVRINFLPIRILSSSPKLNFFINTPLATATAAAGVARLTIQDSIFSNAEFKVEINFGYAANEIFENKKIKIIINDKKIIK
ncbi:MAG: hypothetical protein IJ890_04635 [Clostridia bacterium]|nr:hypothetical protein [Clostridia bacterium]